MYQSLKIVSGKNELGLSGVGILQSKRAGCLIQNVKFDQVYTSDYKMYNYQVTKDALNLILTLRISSKKN
ncbi:unnamed protein product (macronuclear) [Paramecium tetraurelia]|uniref:Uncharacterized protein n=1 Tax=Paramecium tetraurelia TaxID=5888 RepID=A0D4F9_PARTE|nr:uncharacterized protein GSPATT00013392001 [Paramecium tetraurelia]CAK77926.1 unnamed protein product [Paramecium tetraurelia]|eukprot:XP_001445323.1 hypothetical protein (macronuclear) [Paramecium tetraurelia strain d4-2]